MCSHLFGGGIETSFGALLLEGLSIDYGRKSNPDTGLEDEGGSVQHLPGIQSGQRGRMTCGGVRWISMGSASQSIPPASLRFDGALIMYLTTLQTP
jgi:hypothetical protein